MDKLDLERSCTIFEVKARLGKGWPGPEVDLSVCPGCKSALAHAAYMAECSLVPDHLEHDMGFLEAEGKVREYHKICPALKESGE
ncbi:MAG: hypothetical protein GY847_14385 [Proteobacteria bacterium]|nr:hypothetical protein [Pseudomonadota bacterium]